MVLPVSLSQSFLACHREMYEVLWCWWRADNVNADDPTLLAAVLKPTDRPADAAFLNGDLARI